MVTRETDLLPDEKADLRQEVQDMFADPDYWLDMPNDQLGGRKPRDLIGTEDERHVRNLIRAIKYGMFT